MSGWKFQRSYLLGAGTAFVSRNIGGYWAMGVLCRRMAGAGLDTVPIILAPTSAGQFAVSAGGLPLPHLSAVIGRMARRIEVSAMSISLFAVPGISRALDGGIDTMRGEVRVRLPWKDRVIAVEVPFTCRPHDPGSEYRSTRTT